MFMPEPLSQERAGVVRHSQGQAAGIIADCAASAGMVMVIAVVMVVRSRRISAI
jgi:hypothetical protein